MKASPPRRRARFVLFGDSITQQGFSLEHGGWASSLSNAYARKADVINRGYSGYNTRWAKNLLPEVSSHLGGRDDVLSIFFGANDATIEGGTHAIQHVPVEEYSKNLCEMIDYFRSQHEAAPPRIVLVTPPPVHEDTWASVCNEDTSNR